MDKVQFLDLTSTRLDQIQIRDTIDKLGLSSEEKPYKVILFDSTQDFNEINYHIRKSKGLVLICVSDEASNFPYLKLYLGNYKLFIQTPNQSIVENIKNARFFGCGYGRTKLFNKNNEKEYDLSFLGQVTHDRRHMAAQVIKDMSGRYETYLLETEGFTQGLPEEEYFDVMSKSRIVVCPSGIVTQDSLRFYEALEIGAVPVPDAISPIYGYSKYWDAVAPDFPVRPYRSKEELVDRIEQVSSNYDYYQQAVSDWWKRDKKFLEFNLRLDIEEVIRKGESGETGNYS